MVVQKVKLSQLSNISFFELAQTGMGIGQSPNCGLRDASQVGGKAGKQFVAH